jgi:secernin
MPPTLYTTAFLLAPAALACDSFGLLPSATADGLGGLYAKNADRHRTEAQPLAVHPRATHSAGEMIELDTDLKLPQVATTYGHAGSRPNWANRYGGYSEGVNEFGVGIGNEMFPSHHLKTDDPSKPQAEFTDLDRLVLERSKTAAEAVHVLTSLIEQYGQTCKTCPEAANYNSMFMVVDPTEVYSVMAVGHEWGWKRFDEAATNGTGIWTISNWRFLGATNVSATAQATAEANHLWSPSSGKPFDFGEVFGSVLADPSRHRRSMGLLNRLAKDHKLTKADLILTLSDHACTRESAPDGPPEPTPHPDHSCTSIDEMTTEGGITASSMVSDFTTDGRRRIAWHSLTNPSMAVFYPTIFHHDGQATAVPAWLGSSAPWWGFRYVTYTLCGDSLAKIKTVRATWQPIQQRFFAEAESLADKVNDMSAADADAALATFMANVSATIHDTLVHFNKTLS